jgi:FKBP-type peptidyl-prolyl cis-trans isomerase 2
MLPIPPSKLGEQMIKRGSKVKMQFILKVEGKVLHNSVGQEPLAYEHGAGQIFSGLEEQLEGLEAGAIKEIVVPPEKAYGRWKPESVRKVARATFTDPENLKVGETISGEADGEKFQAVITDVGDESVTLDMNHPLAGRTLVFEIHVVEVR